LCQVCRYALPAAPVVILGLDPRRLHFNAGSASAEPSAQGRGWRAVDV